MDFNPALMKAVEQSAYRVTVGDVATQAGLNVEEARQGLLTLASEVGGHLQVAETGDIAYVFPQNLYAILRQKSWRLRVQEWRDRLWGIAFYGIRVSFGVLLILSIVLVFVAIFAILTASSSQKDDRRGGGSMMPRLSFDPYLFYILFNPGYRRRGRMYGDSSYNFGQVSQRRSPRPSGRTGSAEPEMNFLESVFSFLFGDEIPNLDLEEQRWRAIAATIRNQAGAIAAEQVTPYLDQVDGRSVTNDEDYMLPVLVRFNGQPAVSPSGDIVYYFPDLQVTAETERRQSVAAYLKEKPWQFSSASSGQLTLAAGLGALNLVGIGWLGTLFYQNPELAAQDGLIGFVVAIFGVLVAYGIGFFAVPGIRYLWIQRRNARIEQRNARRQARAERLLAPDDALQAKISYARQFEAKVVVDAQNLAYTSERSLLEQDIEKSDQIDAEWQRRLEEREGDRP